ncbi:MAG: glutaredoxin family protein [Gammaproteobacteria bacterium]
MLDVVVYSRRGCHLCEFLLEELVPLCRGRATIRVCDVDERQEWQQAYGNRVPVLCVADREVCAGRLDRDAVLALFPGSP